VPTIWRQLLDSIIVQARELLVDALQLANGIAVSKGRSNCEPKSARKEYVLERLHHVPMLTIPSLVLLGRKDEV
jgi:hypothetical protein